MSSSDLPDANDPNLGLAHPTAEELVKIWTRTSSSWKDSLPVHVFLEESEYLTTVPLAKDGGMTYWILVDKRLSPNERPILCSCESILKRAITSDPDGNVEDAIVHGIASVFCFEEHRGRGYAARHMTEMSKALRNWKSEQGVIIGSILYSDIGKKYYSTLGWLPHPNEAQLVFPSVNGAKPTSVQDILEDDIASLCERDEAMIRAAMGNPSSETKRVTVVPNVEHMLFHIRKEDFATKHLFGHIPKVKGCIAGPPGSQVWAIWYHRYYGHPDPADASNVLYIMRLVVEGDDTRSQSTSNSAGREIAGDQLKALESVIKAAQVDAAEWRLQHVKLWDPTPLVRKAIIQIGLQHETSERDEHIASGLWYDADDCVGATPEWIANEYYSFC
ncbi:lysine acetyltransferase protein [Fusarium flagelliforme]|uniref:Lysine acetyltransferase protein n=1 Tax=Fusarium flagelliforme TaxID=2675880 RepID=A0A395MAS3_9HYPO|nr:lysine acetyltransferase protein [Fusarium flagelliforme]